MPPPRNVFRSLCLLGALFAATGAWAVDPRLEWRTLSTAHFHVHFASEQEDLARRAAGIAEEVHTRLSAALAWSPRRRTHIVITDAYDLANGYATPVPYNQITLYASPPDNLRSLTDFDDWFELLITHEYTHTLHLDRAEALPMELRDVFGRQPLLFPNLFQPEWLIEGLATYHETSAERGIGRGQSALFGMAMRVEVAGGIQPADRVNMSGLNTWPAGRMPYLYGVHFFQFLRQRYGEAALPAWVGAYSDNLVPFQLNTTLQEVYGQRLPALWREFEAYLQTHYGPGIEAIRSRGLVEGERLTGHGYDTASARALADGRVLYVREDRLDPPALMVWEGGVARRLARLHPGARIDVHPEGGVLVAQPEMCENYNLYYDLYQLDLDGGPPRRLTRCQRYRYAAWSPDGSRIAAVAGDGQRQRLDLLDADGALVETVWRGEPREVVSDLDWSPAGDSLLAAVWRRGNWNLELFELARRRWRPLTADAAIEAEPQFSADGGAILYTSEHGGVFNLRRLRLDDGGVETLTNVLGGAFMPTQAKPGGDVYYLGYGRDGYDLYRMPAPHRPLSTPPDLSPAPAPTAPAPVAADAPSRPYRAWETLAPQAWTPSAVVSDELVEVGASTYVHDALGLHEYLAFLGYEPRRERLSGGLSYRYDFYRFSAWRGHRYSYLDGELARIRRENAVSLLLSRPWLGLSASHAAHLGFGGSWEADDYRAAGMPALPDSNGGYLGAAYSHASALEYPRAISPSAGRELRLVAETNSIIDGSQRGEVYTLDWREYLNLGFGQVLQLRLVQGWGTDRPEPFVLGGGNLAFADVLAEQLIFNRRDYPLRGYPAGQPELIGRRMRLLGAEYRFPVATVERGWHWAPLGLRRVSGRLFAEAGAAWREGGSPDRLLPGAGLELVSDLTLGHRYPLRLRIGFAQGFEDGGERQLYFVFSSEL